MEQMMDEAFNDFDFAAYMKEAIEQVVLPFMIARRLRDTRQFERLVDTLRCMMLMFCCDGCDESYDEDVGIVEIDVMRDMMMMMTRSIRKWRQVVLIVSAVLSLYMVSHCLSSRCQRVDQGGSFERSGEEETCTLEAFR
eukprot:768136-Hanusia_phi.AAC.5